MNIKDTINKYQANCQAKDSIKDDKKISVYNSNSKPVVSKKPDYLKKYQPKPHGFNNKKKSLKENNNQTLTHQKNYNENQEIPKTYRRISWKERKSQKTPHTLNQGEISSLNAKSDNKESSLFTKTNADLVSRRL